MADEGQGNHRQQADENSQDLLEPSGIPHKEQAHRDPEHADGDEDLGDDLHPWARRQSGQYFTNHTATREGWELGRSAR